MLRTIMLFLVAAISMCCGQATAQTPADPGTLVQIASFPSHEVAARPVTIWLPADYDPHKGPYDVLYMHDGQNLFRDRGAYGGKEWGVDEAVTRLGREGRIRHTIVVGIWNTPKRLREYMPAKVFARLPDDQRQRVEKLYGGTPLSDAYLKFIVTELKPYIDARYATARGPEHTTIMGSSMGGLISLYALAEYPAVFGAAGCLSSHWALFLPPDGEMLPETDVEAIGAAFTGYIRETLPPAGTHRIWFDHGDQTLDRLYAPLQEQVDRAVVARGWVRGRDWMSKVFPGAAHNEQSWRARLDQPLGFLLTAR
ncbi:MAG TPA: alpha/beta hydrolase-fold protein [Sphingomonas sp.]|nr:alpha/beta hydrolase-fold protein [Sphingomonas sp.]